MAKSSSGGFTGWVERLAREHTRGLAAQARREGLSGDEAVENVIKHAYSSERLGSAELVLWTEPETLCIEVIDYGEWRAPTGNTTGLGIPMMEKLVESVMIHFDERGTRVLLRYPLPAETSLQPLDGVDSAGG